MTQPDLPHRTLLNPMVFAVDWPDDECQYFATCCECKSEFYGNKGRIVCRKCVMNKEKKHAASTLVHANPPILDTDTLRQQRDEARIRANNMLYILRDYPTGQSDGTWIRRREAALAAYKETL